ncbi:MAG: ATP-binding protein [Candidatus Aminicenantes bacterium]|nr:ATP-binding protein [Candidatus Aminicenantes bacterium]
MMAEILHFTVDSALLQELGEKLVETVHLALAELVKNAYDADSSTALVKFTKDGNGEDEIHISDDGVGMNFEEVKKYWMRIATTSKTENNISRKYGRPKTGAKGIGRFCCRRLGARLKLITTGMKEPAYKGGIPEYEKTEVEFYWDSFKAGTDVTEVECPGSQSIIKNGKTGTTLIIGSLTDVWKQRGYNWLKRQLSVLAANREIRREGYEEDPGFNIMLDAPDFEGEVRDLRDDLINAGWGTLKAYINNKHQAVCELDALGIGRKTLVSSQLFTILKDVKLRLGILVDNKKQMRDTGVISKGTLKDILPEWGGVQVRYQGFRIYPYGDDDWLKIDHDRGLRKRIPEINELHTFAQSLQGIDPDRVLLNMLSMRSYVGNVDIGPQANGFEIKANREGFLESEAVDELKKFVRFAIDWATIYRDYYIRVKADEEVEAAREYLERATSQKIDEGKEIESAINYIKAEVDNIAASLPLNKRGSFKKSIKSAVELILKHEESNKAELSHLRLIASSSTLLLIFSHEVKSLLGMLETGKNTIRDIEDKLPRREGEQLKKIGGDLADLKARFQDLLEMTSLVGIGSKREKPMQLALKDHITRSVKIFKLIIDKYDIVIDYDEKIPNNIVIKSIIEAEIYAIVLNVLSNSIKSVIAAGGLKKIEISACRSEGKNVINFKDTGVKLSPDLFEEVFIPFVADPEGNLYGKLNKILNPEDKYIVGVGSGLGLSIVKEIVRARNGWVSFKNPQQNWHNELEIILP